MILNELSQRHNCRILSIPKFLNGTTPIIKWIFSSLSTCTANLHAYSSAPNIIKGHATITVLFLTFFLILRTLQTWLSLQTMKWGDHPVLSGWTLKSRDSFLVMVREGCDDEGESETLTWEILNLPLPTLKTEEGKHKPKNVVASRSWKRQESKFSLCISREEPSPANTSVLAQAPLLTYRTVK